MRANSGGLGSTTVARVVGTNFYGHQTGLKKKFGCRPVNSSRWSTAALMAEPMTTRLSEGRMRQPEEPDDQRLVMSEGNYRPLGAMSMQTYPPEYLGGESASRADDAKPAAKRFEYPALADCIRNQRPPTPNELKRVAARMLRETGIDMTGSVAFTDRRAALHAAKAALLGR